MHANVYAEHAFAGSWPDLSIQPVGVATGYTSVRDCRYGLVAEDHQVYCINEENDWPELLRRAKGDARLGE